MFLKRPDLFFKKIIADLYSAMVCTAGKTIKNPAVAAAKN